jgi:hypothetical protein
MGLPATSVGITEDTFVAFNGMLDVLLDAGAGGTGGPARKEAAPSSLVNEPARPMPSQAELKMGSLAAPPKPAAAGGVVVVTTGLCEAELELMETLDKADNMLNSGSFGDFDRLIGDVNDPRLQVRRALFRPLSGPLSRSLSIPISSLSVATCRCAEPYLGLYPGPYLGPYLGPL